MRLILLAFGALVAAYPGAKGKPDHSGIFKALIERAGERLAERQGIHDSALIYSTLTCVRSTIPDCHQDW